MLLATSAIVASEPIPVKVTFVPTYGYKRTLEFMHELKEDNPDRWVTCGQFSLLWDSEVGTTRYSMVCGGSRIKLSYNEWYRMFAEYSVTLSSGIATAN